MAIQQENFYNDIDFTAAKNAVTNDISYKKDMNAIAQSIKNIVLTTKGEKIFNFKFGSAGQAFLETAGLLPFEQNILITKIYADLQIQEPRAIIKNVNIKFDETTGIGTLNISFSPVFDERLIKTVRISDTKWFKNLSKSSQQYLKLFDNVDKLVKQDYNL